MNAIFLSYASQDADAARRICDAMRAAGLEVWFDQSELRGGDAWDASIRKQIKECSLFLPIISANTQARDEGYFRLEWKLAVDRSHLMADDKTFFFPIVIDATTDAAAKVPDRFRERQWTRLTSDQATESFAARIANVIDGSASPAKNAPGTAPVLVSAEKPLSTLKTKADDTPSVAVLAFANRSASADDEYFSDGLADELLSMLAKIKGLRVAARTSAFSFKGKSVTVAEIGLALNVAAVLEGSVRKSGDRARIAVQLVKVADGYPLWSETYDRTLDDIFAVQDEIAQAVVTELRKALIGDAPPADQRASVGAEVADAARGRTENAEAHRLVLQASFFMNRGGSADLVRAIDCMREALQLDPEYALAWASLSRSLSMASAFGSAPVVESCEEAFAAGTKALHLQPDLLQGHIALCWYEMVYGWNWQAAEASLQRALQTAPNSAEALVAGAALYCILGRFEQSRQLSVRAVECDPLSTFGHRYLARALECLDRFEDAEQAYRKALLLSPNAVAIQYSLAVLLSWRNQHAEAHTEMVQVTTEFTRLTGTAIVYFRAGKRAEADEALRLFIENHADHSAMPIGVVYAARGDADACFEWLERAYVQRDSGVVFLKASRWCVPMHSDPRWLALLGKLGLAD